MSTISENESIPMNISGIGPGESSALEAKESLKRQHGEISAGRKKTPENLKAPAKKITKKTPLSEIVQVLVENNVPKNIAEKIAEGYEKGWEGFVQEERIEGKPLYRQTHSVKGLKVYRDPFTNELAADFGFKTLGEGGFKRAKWVVRFTELGVVAHRVRLAKRKEGVESSEEEEIKRIFDKDIKKELDTRAWLILAGEGKPIPHLLEIRPIHYKSNKPGSPLKTRYDTEKCEGDLTKLYQKGPEETRDALHYCSQAFQAIAEIHRRGFVHKDLKLENVFFAKGSGLVADLGLCARLPDEKGEGGDPYIPFSGSPGTAAPEVLFGAEKNSPAMDVFSSGLLLLAFSRPVLYEALVQEQRDMLDKTNAVKKSVENFQRQKNDLLAGKGKWNETERAKQIERRDKLINDRIKEMENAQNGYKLLLAQAQNALTSYNDPLDSLIAKLIDLNPEKRLPSDEVEKKYLEYIDSPAFEARFG